MSLTQEFFCLLPASVKQYRFLVSLQMGVKSNPRGHISLQMQFIFDQVVFEIFIKIQVEMFSTHWDIQLRSSEERSRLQGTSGSHQDIGVFKALRFNEFSKGVNIIRQK